MVEKRKVSAEGILEVMRALDGILEAGGSGGGGGCGCLSRSLSFGVQTLT